jgi:hypothetical protein
MYLRLDYSNLGGKKKLLLQGICLKYWWANDTHTIKHHGAGSVPDPSVPEVKGLYVCGDWVGKEGRLADSSKFDGKCKTSSTIYSTIERTSIHS